MRFSWLKIADVQQKWQNYLFGKQPHVIGTKKAKNKPSRHLLQHVVVNCFNYTLRVPWVSKISHLVWEELNLLLRIFCLRPQRNEKCDSPTTPRFNFPCISYHKSLNMVKDEELIELAHPEYWNTRYASEQKATEDGTKNIESYEWFRTFEVLKPFFINRLPPPSNDLHILQLGCGNSVCPFPIPLLFSNPST